MRFSAAATVATFAALAAAPALAAPLQAPFQQLTFEGASAPALAGAPTAMRLVASAAQYIPGVRELTEPRLVQVAHDSAPYWTTEFGKMLLRYNKVNFFDLTASGGAPAPLIAQAEPSYPKHTAFAKELKPVFANVSEAGPRKNLEGFTSFRNRYYKSETGKQSQQWLLRLITELVSQHSFISVKEHPHSWGQNSIILHIAGSTAKLSSSEPDVAAILGAHLDSTNMFPFLAAPGADDDGSGTVTLIEALRALLSQGWRPERNVEFHWYSAEEGGLLGSQEVASSYAQKGTTVGAMLQQDMTAFVKPGTEPRVGIVRDFVSLPLSSFVELLVGEYLDIPAVDTKLGYAGSDHASWTKVGIPGAFAIEATFEDSNLQNIHTGNDRIDIEGFSFEHLQQFVKLSASFAVELGGWSKK